MNKLEKWMIAGVAAVTIAGIAYVVPAAAASFGGGQMHRTMGGMHGMGGMGGMMQMMKGDMMSMHNTMMPLMDKMPAMHTEMVAALSKVLGVTPEALTKAMDEGATPAQMAREKGIALEELKGAMTSIMTEFLGRLVQEQSITQEQADQVKGFMAEHQDTCLNSDSGMMKSMGEMMKHMKQSF